MNTITLTADKDISNIMNMLSDIKSSLQTVTPLSKKWLSTKELASYLGYSIDGIKKLLNVEFILDLHYYKKGKLLFDIEAIDAWVINGKQA